MKLTPEQITQAQEEVALGESANLLLGNPLWVRMRAEIEAEIMAELLKAPIDDTKTLTHLKLFARAMVEVEVRVRKVATTGRLAGEGLRQHYQAESGLN